MIEPRWILDSVVVNGFSLNAPEPESVIMIEQLAADGLSEIDLAQWLSDSSVPVA